MALTFRGGVFLEEEALALNSPIREMPAPELITLPLSGHQKATVAVGDRVLKGQTVADGENCIPVFASVSGTVDAIRFRPTGAGRKPCIIIKNDFKDEIDPALSPFDTPIRKAESEPLLRHFREKGIVDFGGDGAPLWKTLSEAKGKATRIIIRCVETDPAFASSRQLILEQTEEILGGIKIMMRATGIEKAIFALDETQEDVADALLKRVRISKNFAVAILKNKYPQGDTHQLVSAILKKEIPKGHPSHAAGAVVIGPEACRATFHAFVSGLPPVTRLLTVSGNCVKTPSNLLVPVGASLKSVLEFCGCTKKPGTLLSGGRMKGRMILNLNRPVTAAETGVLALNTVPKEAVASPCIHCGKCAEVCPMHLVPSKLYRSVEKGDLNTALFYDIDSCTECGCCSYVCPAKIQLRLRIRAGKTLLAKKRAAKGGER